VASWESARGARKSHVCSTKAQRSVGPSRRAGIPAGLWGERNARVHLVCWSIVDLFLGARRPRPAGEDASRPKRRRDGTTPRPESLYGHPFAYTGQRYDSQTGLYHFWARVYSPQLGRFLQEDAQGVLVTASIALGYQGGTPGVTPPVTGPADEYPDLMNLYAYAQGNPTRFTDPLGLMSHGELTVSTAGGAATYGGLMPALGGAVAWMQGVIGAMYVSAFMTSMSIMAGGYCMMEPAASSALCDEVARFYDNIGDQPEHVRDGFEEAARTGDQNLDPNRWRPDKPISIQKQARHAKDWIDGMTEGEVEQLVQQAYRFGEPYEGQATKLVYETGRVIGGNGETRILVHVAEKSIHGHPTTGF